MEKLKNIGPVLQQKLSAVGIHTVNDLLREGSENAFIKLSTIDKNVCINTLYALESAIQDCNWHNLSLERKQELLNFFHYCKKQLQP